MTFDGTLYRYAGFGVVFDCEIPCPGFPPGEGEPEARVRLGAVPERLREPIARGVTFEAEPDRVLLQLPGVRFLIENGNAITVQADPDTPEESVRVFLPGALAILQLQRGVFMLHAAACASARGAIVLAGFSGRGKSTLLAALLARGHEMLADDLSAIVLDPAGHPVAQPAFASVRLFADSLGRLGLDGRDARPVRPGVRKYAVPAPAELCRRPRRIAAVYVLDYHAPHGVEFLSLAGQERLAALRAHVYAQRLVEALRLNRTHFSVAAAVAARVPVVRISRPRGFAYVDLMADAIERGSL